MIVLICPNSKNLSTSCGTFILYCLLSYNVTAAPGDKLSIGVELANMREGPSTNYPVLMRLEQGRKLVEIQRQNKWVEVETGRSNIKSGWIYAPLLKKEVTGKPTIVLKNDGSTNPLFELFKLAFDELNENIKSETGQIFFTKVENPDNRTIQLTATESWLNAPRKERQEKLSEIFKIWDAAIGDGLPITVDIIDKNGDRLMLMFR